MPCERCRGSGWICEHPDRPRGHDGCEEPGAPCSTCQDIERPRLPADFVSLMDDSTPFYTPNRKVGIPRQRRPGIEVWRLHFDGRVQTCEVRDDSRAGAGFGVMVLEDGEPLFSRRCVDQRGARYVANSFKQDLLRTGWRENA